MRAGPSIPLLWLIGPPNEALAVFAAACVLAIAIPAKAQTPLNLCTGLQGFWNYSAATATAKVASDNGFNLRLHSQGESCVPAVNARKMEFGFGNELDIYYAVTGQAAYGGKPQTDLRVVAIMSPFYTVLFVRHNSEVKTIADLKGKRVPSDYTSTPVLDRLVQGMLANAGLTSADVQNVPVPNLVNAADAFADGRLDTFLFALGGDKVAETDTKLGGIRVLPIDPSPEAMARLRKFIPVAYPIEIRPGHVGVREPTKVYAYDYVLVASTSVPDDAVYRLTKIIHDNKAALAANFAALRELDPKRMAKDMGPAQFHPGAIKFYLESGIWPPKPPG